MKLLIALALLACAPIFAQTCASPTAIGITGPVNALSGPLTGTINLLMSYTIPGNPPVVQSQLQVAVTAGAMIVCLPAGAAVVASYSVPNPSPLTGSTRFTRFWAVPASGGPYTLYSGVETVIPSTPNLFVSWGQLPQPPSTGTYCLGSVTGAIGWNTCSGSGGSSVWGGITGTLANQTDLAAALSGKEPSITAGTTSQYWRGDKSFQSLSAAVLPLFSASSPLLYNSTTGLFSIQQANTSQAGFLSAADWNTFNGKQATITTGTTGQYFRGDFSLATLPAFAANTGAVPHQFFTAYNSTTGAFSAAQPAFTDISGSLGHGQLPALLSADIPNNAASTTGSSASVIAGSASTSIAYVIPNISQYTSLFSVGNAAGGGVPGGYGQTAGTMAATADSTNYYNPVYRFNVQNGTSVRSMYEMGVEGCYTSSGADCTGSYYTGYHAYFWDFHTGLTVWDTTSYGGNKMTIFYPLTLVHPLTTSNGGTGNTTGAATATKRGSIQFSTMGYNGSGSGLLENFSYVTTNVTQGGLYGGVMAIFGFPSTSTPTVAWTFVWPADFDPTQAVTLTVGVADGGYVGGNTKLNASIACVAAGTNMGNPFTFGTVATSGTVSLNSTFYLQNLTITPIDVTTLSCAAGELASLKLLRDTTVTGGPSSVAVFGTSLTYGRIL